MQLYLKQSAESDPTPPRILDIDPAPLMAEKSFHNNYVLWSGKVAPKASTQGGEDGEFGGEQGREEVAHFIKGEWMPLVTCRSSSSASGGTSLLVQRDPTATYLAGSASVNAHCASFSDPEDPILLKHAAAWRCTHQLQSQHGGVDATSSRIVPAAPSAAIACKGQDP